MTGGPVLEGFISRTETTRYVKKFINNLVKLYKYE